MWYNRPGPIFSVTETLVFRKKGSLFTGSFQMFARSSNIIFLLTRIAIINTVLRYFLKKDFGLYFYWYIKSLISCLKYFADFY